MFNNENPIERVPRSTGTLYRQRIRQDWPDDRDFRILSIDGGGIRGILPLAFMAQLEVQHLSGQSIASYFDLICGTSTGGIIALGLAKGLTSQELLDIYIRRGVEVFPDYAPLSKHLRKAANLVVNRCDTASLYKLIDEIVDKTKLWESQCRLCIPAAETRNFEPFIFKTPHHPDYRIDYEYDMSFVAKTTSAAPAHFSPANAGDGFEFIDGGVWANNPAMIGVADTLACFSLRREQLRVLSLGCGRSDYEMTWMRRRLGGFLFWSALMFETMHIQSANVVGQARLICGGDRVLRVDPFLQTEIPLWDWAASKSLLPNIGHEFANNLGGVVNKNFFATKAANYSPIYTPSHPPGHG